MKEKIIKKYEKQLDNVAVSGVVQDTIVNVEFAKRALRRAVNETIEKLKKDTIEVDFM